MFSNFHVTRYKSNHRFIYANSFALLSSKLKAEQEIRITLFGNRQSIRGGWNTETIVKCLPMISEAICLQARIPSL